MKHTFLKLAYFVFPLIFFFGIIFFIYSVIIPPRTPQILKIFATPIREVMEGNELQHYSLDVRPNLKERSIEVDSAIHVSSSKNGERFFFLLNPGLKIYRAKYGNKEIKVWGVWILRWFSIPKGVARDKKSILRLSYRGRLKTLNLAYGHISESGFMLRSEELWYPTNLRSFFTADIRENIPAGITPILLGKVIKNEISDEGRLVEMHLDSPTTHFSLAAGDYSESIKKIGGIEYRLYIPPSCIRCKADKILATVSKANSLYRELYGGNSIPALSLLVDPKEARSFNHGAGFMTVDSDARLTIFHEVAHNWWGEIVSHDWLNKEGNGGLWIMEGFAEYSSFAAAEKIIGGEEYINLLKRATFSNKLERSVASLTAFDSIGGLGQVKDIHQLLYTKGARILIMLRETMGETKFYEAVRQFLNSYRHTAANGLDFERVIESKVDVSIETFFDDWLRGTGRLDLALKVLDRKPIEGGRFTTKVKITNVGDIAIHAIIKVDVGTSDKNKIIWAEIGERESLLEIETDSAITAITLDPDFVWADMNRKNNSVQLGKD